MPRITNELICARSKTPRKLGESDSQLLPRITHLGLNGLKLEKLEGLSECASLEVLYVYDNMLTTLDGIHTLAGTLRHLFAQNNLLYSVRRVMPLQHLTKLYLDGNQLSLIDGMEGLVRLEELHLKNQFPELPSESKEPDRFTFDDASLATLSRCLKVLDVSSNGIASLGQLARLTSLTSLDLSNNLVSSLQEVHQLLESLPRLRVLDMRGCPVHKLPNYRKSSVPHSPSLVTLDGRDISPVEKQSLAKLHAKQKEPQAAGSDDTEAEDTLRAMAANGFGSLTDSGARRR